MNEPKQVQKRAIDVTPYNHGIYCTVAGSEPFVNPIVVRRWRDDGASISFMLDSHNFEVAAPDELMTVVEIESKHRDMERILAEDALKMAKRPAPQLTIEQLQAERPELLRRITELESQVEGCKLAAEVLSDVNKTLDSMLECSQTEKRYLEDLVRDYWAEIEALRKKLEGQSDAKD